MRRLNFYRTAILLNRTSGFLFQKASPKKSINDDRIRRMGAGQETNGVVQRKRVPLFLWKKNRPLLLLLSVPTPRGVLQSCKCLPIGRDSVFGGYSDILLSAKLKNDTISLSATPINRCCRFLLRKVSPLSQRVKVRRVSYRGDPRPSTNLFRDVRRSYSSQCST